MRKKPLIAICYDFDGTLAPGNMQEYSYFPEIITKPKNFWKETQKRAEKENADQILCYMSLMLEKAKRSENNARVTKKAFKEYGENIVFFKGVKQWFKRINQYARTRGAKVEHYIISSGVKEMIKGTRISKEFKEVYASSFTYDKYGIAQWPGLAVNYTTKTQFLFRINKGTLEAWDNTKINKFTRMEDRPVPFERMIYIGDGETDVPCMRLVKNEGGYSIAVYKPRAKGAKKSSVQLRNDGRIDFFAIADYRQDKPLDRQVRRRIDEIVASYKRLSVEKV